MSDPIRTAEQAHRELGELHPHHGSSTWIDYLVYGMCGVAVTVVIALVLVGYIGGM